MQAFALRIWEGQADLSHFAEALAQDALSCKQANKIAFNKWSRSTVLLPLLYLTIVLNQNQLKHGLYFDSCICGDMRA